MRKGCSFAVSGVALRRFRCSSGPKATPILTEKALFATQKWLSAYPKSLSLGFAWILLFKGSGFCLAFHE